MYDVIYYFKAFPLKTKKAQSFDRWLTIHNIISNKLHLSQEGNRLILIIVWQTKQDSRILKRRRYSPILLVRGAHTYAGKYEEYLLTFCITCIQLV
jgi:hypothetical protein